MKAVASSINKDLFLQNITLIMNNFHQSDFNNVIKDGELLLKVNQTNTFLINLIGVSYSKIKNYEKAEAYFKLAIKYKPEIAEYYNNLGALMNEVSEFRSALDPLKKALKIKPSYLDALSNIGNSYRELSNFEMAQKFYIAAIQLKPNNFEVMSNLGFSYLNDGKFEQALKILEKSTSINSNYSPAYLNKGVYYYKLGDNSKSISNFKKVIELDPNNSKAYNNISNILSEQGKYEDAIGYSKKAISINPDDSESHYNIGVTFYLLGKSEEAIASYTKAIELNPNYVEAHQNLSFALLNSGKLREGFNEYEWRWKTDKFLSYQRYFSRPLWDGKESLHGKTILLWCEQGIGDTLNWSSCLPLVTAQAEHCVVECQQKLVPLLKRSFPNVEIKAVDNSIDSKRDDFDFHLPMGSLYKHFIPEISQNSKVDSYLIPDPVRVKFWSKRLNSLGKGPYIGISWKSSNMEPKRLPNYTSISAWSPILKISDVTFINLQYVNFEDDLKTVQDELGVTVHNFNDLDQMNNIDDVAALCAALDMVVSIKNTVPLISVGVGTSTKIPTWRQSTWNNVLHNPVGLSAHIFERNTREPWDDVFRLIAEDIFELTKNWSF